MATTIMAYEKQLELSNFIKQVHENLRNDSKVLGYNAAWMKHCSNKTTLKKYAEAMNELSNEYWEKNCNKEKATAFSRIQWVYNYCTFYFFDKEIIRQRVREQDISSKVHVDVTPKFIEICEKLKLLDVGSCFNPFKSFSNFEVCAIDIAPATDDVRFCDFLNISVTDSCVETEINGAIRELERETYHVVLFSLLLEYLPSPEQRMLCCRKAYELLCFEGLLVIITPDSKHVGANAKYMKSWRYHLAKIGFSRIKYEKFPHIHCMAFRKSIHHDVASRWASLQNKNTFFKKIFIPQDFKKEKETLEEIPIFEHVLSVL
ncbi:hypothetical protein FQA39_LY06264 [Lamprigera yunnana]|nr:hypothetical protein FQA39_LY06264 [Lamprigera yunnana]